MFENDDYLNWILYQAHARVFPRLGNALDMHPSSPSAVDASGSHHGSCIRAEYYKRTGAEPDGAEDIRGTIIMDSGSALGDKLAQYFMNCNVAIAPNGTEGEYRILIPRETPAGNKYNVSGRLDMLCLGPNKEYILYEFKTVWSAGKANRVIKGWRCQPTPDVKNLMQVALYADYARRHMGVYDCRLAYLYVEGKMGKVYHITVDSDGGIYCDGTKQSMTVPDIYNQFDRLVDALIAGEPPDREGELFYTDEQLLDMAMNNQMSKKMKGLYDSGDPILVSWSPCTFCDYIGVCRGKDQALLAAKAREKK